MKIDYIPIDYHNLNDCTILAKWFNDPKISHLISPNFNPGVQPPVTPIHISNVNTHPKNEKYAYFITCDGKIIGDINIIDNPDYLLKTEGNSCWLGITIGEQNYQGLGIGKKAMAFIERLAIELGFNRLELGVFEFNTRAINFYKGLGYKEIGVSPKFTFYQGIWYDDLRFEKYF